jgi:hypothetical protein
LAYLSQIDERYKGCYRDATQKETNAADDKPAGTHLKE